MRPLLLAFTLLVAAGPAAAQRSQLSLELNPVHGTLGYAPWGGPERRVGLEAGFGFPQLDRTIEPSDQDFMNFLHLGAFVRVEPSPRVSLDASARAGLADITGQGDDIPETFLGVSGSAMFGWRRFKVGPRLIAGSAKLYGEPARFVLSVTPFAIRFSYP